MSSNANISMINLVVFVTVAKVANHFKIQQLGYMYTVYVKCKCAQEDLIYLLMCRKE